MTNPPTLPEAGERGLLVDHRQGIHTFSNGSQWYSWADGNCDQCRFYDPDAAGALCAFEGASLLSIVSPELARMFGWIQDPQWDKPADHRNGWDAPQECAYFRRKGDSDDDRPHAPAPDPTQLVLIADPTEDAGMLRVVEVPEREPVSV